MLPHGSDRGGTPSVIFDRSSLRSKVKRLSGAFASKYVTLAKPEIARMYHFEKKNSKIFSPEGPRENV